MNSGQPTSTRPLTYVIIPLLALFVICSTGLFFHVRRRRRRLIAADSSIWGRGRWVTRDGTIVFVPRHTRRSPWGGLHSQEGLNELGEAPPPYKFKVFPGEGGGAAEEGALPLTTTELRDMEEGRRPPEYGAEHVAEPPPAVVADERRTGV
ncbi:hypothetical protein MKX07_002262 [Trichoderma sp. CBMAI-0711]|uniref:Uncharacterized protein n=1 Tax=Trichoderma parareesei TaxID=858221 RepID=A0A2H2ZU41_TRIPA|nr:hypothetical protein MKX07_002262 [Trichoderma sp. CBMAI-0711]OTA06630.1 hypothetical protein A9Z42_0073860 [Trichoderma parareesei]